MQIIETQYDTVWLRDKHSEYRFWKYNRNKYAQWLNSRHLDNPFLDVWDHYILKNKLQGKTLVYDSQAIFWKQFGALVVENSVPDVVRPYVEILTPELDVSLENTVSNLILYGPLSSKYIASLVEYLTVPMEASRSGPTPCLIKWLKPTSKIFFSFYQEYANFNRLKLTLPTWINLEAAKFFESHKFTLEMQSYSSNDYVNGQVKMVFSRHQE